jgi:spermidine/putrescine transport system permease protein
MKAHNWPFAAALAVVLTVITSVMIGVYRKISGVKELEGIV